MTTRDDAANAALAALADELRQIKSRLAALEDENAVVAVLTSYGFAVDAGDPQATAALYSENCRIEIDTNTVIDGQGAVRAMVLGAEHQAILPGCAHIMGPFVVTIDGDRAWATGYGTIYVRDGDGPRLMRQSAGHWKLSRQEGGWKIDNRRAESLGTQASQDLFKSALSDP